MRTVLSAFTEREAARKAAADLRSASLTRGGIAVNVRQEGDDPSLGNPVDEVVTGGAITDFVWLLDRLLGSAGASRPEGSAAVDIVRAGGAVVVVQSADDEEAARVQEILLKTGATSRPSFRARVISADAPVYVTCSASALAAARRRLVAASSRSRATWIVRRCLPRTSEPPRLHRQQPVALCTRRLFQRRVAGATNSLGVRGDAHDVAVRLDHVGDRRADDRLARRHVFERLGRADEAGRLVQRERQQADVPAGEAVRQRVVRLLAQVVDVGAPRQRGRVDLDDRADHDDLPVRIGVGQRGDQVEVEALVDHAEEAQARVAGSPCGSVRAGAMRRRRTPSCAKCAASTLLGKQCTLGGGRAWPRTGSARR